MLVRADGYVLEADHRRSNVPYDLVRAPAPQDCFTDAFSVGRHPLASENDALTVRKELGIPYQRQSRRAFIFV